MDNTPHVRLPLPDRSYASFIKKEVRRIADSVGFSPYKLAEIDIIVSEIVSNLVKYAVDGELLVKPIVKNEIPGLEILSIDRGPGMSNPAEMLKDGSSTSHTLGEGLGAIRRLSDEFGLYSQPGWGTILLSRSFTALQNTKEKQQIAVNVVMLPKTGETVSGDGWATRAHRQQYKILALDGLGHGPEANKATKTAVDFFASNYAFTPSETLKLMHKHMRGTRGAVGMLFNLEPAANTFAACGVGNISARIIGADKTRNCISYNGIIGYSMPNTLSNNTFLWNADETLVIHSDGLKTRWDINQHPGLNQQDGSILAAALYKDFSRGNDDILIMVVKKIKR